MKVQSFEQAHGFHAAFYGRTLERRSELLIRSALTLQSAADYRDRHIADQGSGDGSWSAICDLADIFRSATPSQRLWIFADPPRAEATWNAFLAGVIEDLCGEFAIRLPAWTIGMVAPEPFWIWPNVTQAVKEVLRDLTKPCYARRNVLCQDICSRAREQRSSAAVHQPSRRFRPD